MKRVYVVDYSLCTIDTCGRPCIAKCPVNITSKTKTRARERTEIPIRVKESTNQIIIKSEFCIRCGVCANVCPVKAIHVKNVIEEDRGKGRIHAYATEAGGEGFRLYGLPVLVPGRVTGLCGPNGIGKSTVFDILAGLLKPNFGNHARPGEEVPWGEFVKHVKEAEMRDHFTGLYAGRRRVAYKKQVLNVLFDQFRGKTVQDVLGESAAVDAGFFDEVMDELDIHAIAGRHLEQCSGGELQRFAIAQVLVSDAEVYLVDEPCTFLDVKKRIALARLLEARAGGSGEKHPILVVEHDLTVLDYMSDVINLFYGVPHQFGIVTNVQTTKAGINSYLKGFVKTENVEFRDTEITFKRTSGGRRWDNARVFASYGRITKTFEGFKLEIEPGVIFMSEILGVVGENGLGKSTLAKILAGKLPPDPGCSYVPLATSVSYKPQYITREYEGTVKQFITDTSQNFDFSENMLEPLYRPLGVDRLFEKRVDDLSGGELQRVFIVACLAARADLYVLDEPSAYLDVEERLHVSSVIRANTKRSHSTTICIEHDIQIADALADRMLIFAGTPGVHGHTIGPLDKRDGMNAFLKMLDVTFRRDEDTGRARINKKDSQLDKAQRSSGQYFYEN
ncbi:MAG: ribosome biogenesis/translation initiation ATPase RLI [Candidatus Lokiarchaeota archaeon]|nr:ribosome biogenesis/translation initiation ATPase RLI [Candidatus Lokiarchaeota archaeon]